MNPTNTPTDINQLAREFLHTSTRLMNESLDRARATDPTSVIRLVQAFQSGATLQVRANLNLGANHARATVELVREGAPPMPITTFDMHY